MRVEENVTIYRCEHCKKKMFRKHAMVAHEEWCNKNPKNTRVCHFCPHLEKINVRIDIEQQYGSHKIETIGFKCNKLNIELYPFSAEKKKLPSRFLESFEEKEPMKNSCEHFDEAQKGFMTANGNWDSIFD